MNSLALIATARSLLAPDAQGDVPECNRRRAVSTAYYALYHCLAECCANMLVGHEKSSRTRPEWREVYRALDHGTLRSRTNDRRRMGNFPEEIRGFMILLVGSQERRHSADYDPFAVAFEQSTVEKAIDNAERAIHAFNGVAEDDRRALAAYVHISEKSVQRRAGTETGA